jgi:AraC-like DNA-binding protein
MLGSTIDVLWTARYDYQPGWTLALHQHTYFQMLYILGGKGALQIGETRVPLRAGQCFLIRPDVVHGATASGAIRTLDIKFNVRNPGLHKSLMAAPAFGTMGESAIPELLERIRNEGEHRHPFYRDVCSALMAEIVLLYLRRHSGLPERPAASAEAGEQVNDPLLRRTLEYIRQNYASAMVVTDIAKGMGCCDRSLRLHFRNVMGIGPLEYLQRYRLARAKELIEYSDYSLKEIAVRVGFKTIQHFTRLFAASEGMAPGAWRQRYREGIRKDVCINPRFENPDFTVRK